MRKRIASVFLALLLGACATVGELAPPSISLVDLRLGAISLLSQELLLDIRIGNPNDIPLPLNGLTFRLEINGKFLAEGFSNKKVTVPRLDYATVPVKGVAGTVDIVRQIMTLGGADTIDYRISGIAYVEGAMGRRSVPYERKGSLSLLPPPPTPSGPSGSGTKDNMRTLVPR